MNIDSNRILLLARQALEVEARALSELVHRLDEEFVKAVQLILACPGRVVVMGMGKSGHVGRKIAATLASTGTPAMFVHPGEASHGDLGMVTQRDVVIAISNSGESEELNVVLPALRRMGVTIVAITGQADSSLARHAQVCISSAVQQEACPLNLAPTASTTAQMALGDALAVALLDARGFGKEDFARSHPGGALGRRLLVHVRDLMRKPGEALSTDESASLAELLQAMSRGGMGIAAVVDEAQRIRGVFTDGDLRRLIEGGANLQKLCAGEVMNTEPCTIRDDALAVEAAALMESRKVTSILVLDSESRLVGALNTNTLLRAKVI